MLIALPFGSATFVTERQGGTARQRATQCPTP
jgi:hypothetical protein